MTNQINFVPDSEATDTMLTVEGIEKFDAICRDVVSQQAEAHRRLMALIARRRAKKALDPEGTQ